MKHLKADSVEALKTIPDLKANLGSRKVSVNANVIYISREKIRGKLNVYRLFITRKRPFFYFWNK